MQISSLFPLLSKCVIDCCNIRLRWQLDFPIGWLGSRLFSSFIYHGTQERTKQKFPITLFTHYVSWLLNHNFAVVLSSSDFPLDFDPLCFGLVCCICGVLFAALNAVHSKCTCILLPATAQNGRVWAIPCNAPNHTNKVIVNIYFVQ